MVAGETGYKADSWRPLKDHGLYALGQDVENKRRNESRDWFSVVADNGVSN